MGSLPIAHLAMKPTAQIATLRMSSQNHTRHQCQPPPRLVPAGTTLSPTPLPSAQLTGNIPPEITIKTTLQELKLENNYVGAITTLPNQSGDAAESAANADIGYTVLI